MTPDTDPTRPEEEAVPTEGQTVPPEEETVPSGGGPIPPEEQILPSGGGSIPAPEAQTVPSGGQVQEDEQTPAAGQAQSLAREKPMPIALAGAFVAGVVVGRIASKR